MSDQGDDEPMMPLPPQKPFWLDLVNGMAGLLLLAGMALLVLWFTDWRGWTTPTDASSLAKDAASPTTSFLSTWFPSSKTGTGTSTTNTTSVGYPSTLRLVTSIGLILLGFAGIGLVLYQVSKSRHAYNVWYYQRISQRERAILAIKGGVADLPPDATAASAIKNMGLSVASFSSTLASSPSTTI